MRNVVLRGNVAEQKLFPWDRFVFFISSNIIQFLNPGYQRFLLCNIFITHRILCKFNQGIMHTILQCNSFFGSNANQLPEFKQYFCLLFFNQQIWQEIFYKHMAFKMCQHDCMERLSVWGIWLLYIPTSTIMSMNQIYNFWIRLFNSSTFSVAGIRGIFSNTDSIGISFNCEIPIRIHSSSQISKLQFSHNNITFVVGVQVTKTKL